MGKRPMFILIIGWVAFAGVNAMACGFALYEGSARGNALGGAMTARDGDAGSIYFNPAAITDTEVPQIMAGATLIRPEVEVVVKTPRGDEVSTKTKQHMWVPPHVYATYPLNDKFWAGLGAYSRFGLGTEFPSDWPGRFNSYKAIINTLSLNPNLAWKVDEHLSIAIGASAMWFDLELCRRLALASGETDLCMIGDSWGYGYNVGVRYKFSPSLAFGVAYQSPIVQNVEGHVDVGSRSIPGSGEIELPDMLFLGMAVKPLDRLSVEVGGILTCWSTYQELTVSLDQPLAPGVSTLRSEKHWDDIWRYSIGAEYELSASWVLRAGYAYVQSPDSDAYADYIVPANDRQLLNVGIGYRMNVWQIDASYSYVSIADRAVPAQLQEGVLPSRFEDSHAYMIGLTASRVW